MPTLDLNQITDKLNAEFAGDTRKIVFWYDDAAEFVGDIDTLDIIGAKLLKLEHDAMFKAKHLLEREDTESNYLVYAPFPKPEPRDNVLEDTLLYSRRFYADRASLLVSDLRMDEKFKPVIQKYIKFFGAKDRTQRFYDLEIETFPDESAIETAIMSAICKTGTSSIEEVLRVVLLSGDLNDNTYMSDFENYGLLPAFWKQCEDAFGFTSNAPSLMQLAVTMLITYTARQFKGDIPQAWKEHVSYKSGSITAFINSLMNNIVYKPQFDKLAALVESELNVRNALKNVSPECVLDCDVFSVFDEMIISWINERLLDEDIGASLNGMGIKTVCEYRRDMHFGELYAAHYDMLKSAYLVSQAADYRIPGIFKDIMTEYIEDYYKADTAYRHFYTALDRLDDASDFEDLRILVENIYTNDYLGKLLPAWCAALNVKTAMENAASQTNFYKDRIRNIKDKTVVIISDALRFEVARELLAKLEGDQNCNVESSYILSALPSYTQLGMAALLPHKTLELADNGNVLVDGKPSNSTDKREAILQAAMPDTRAVSYDNLPSKRDEMREIFTGMDAVYLYHNHIDERGSNSENEVFNACLEAVNEIYTLIKRLSGSANVYRFIITADHGFLYKREKFAESDKINIPAQETTYQNRRFIIADEPIDTDGVLSFPLSDVIGGEDTRYVSTPVGANVFKTAGGLNFVHGGASPQEMIVPLITVKTEKGHVEIYPAKIALVSIVPKITNLITQLDFIQQDPVSDVVKQAEYRLYFISEDKEKISNEHIYKADRKDKDPNKRMFRLRFSFKNKKYDAAKKYWLVAVNTESGVDMFRHQVLMDIAFADDFGFGV